MSEQQDGECTCTGPTSEVGECCEGIVDWEIFWIQQLWTHHWSKLQILYQKTTLLIQIFANISSTSESLVSQCSLSSHSELSWISSRVPIIKISLSSFVKPATPLMQRSETHSQAVCLPYFLTLDTAQMQKLPSRIPIPQFLNKVVAKPQSVMTKLGTLYSILRTVFVSLIVIVW